MSEQPALPTVEDADEPSTRQLSEALQELRVAMPGVQLLFGFLLIVPFNSRFDTVTELQKGLYSIALISAAISSVCFIAPAAYHRLVFQRQQRDQVIRVAQHSLTSGLSFLGVALVASVGLATGEVLPAWAAATLTATLAVAIGALWFGLGLARRRGSHKHAHALD